MARAAARTRIPERWVVVIALFAVTACVSTSVSAFGVFLPVLSEAFGWPRGAVSVALSINLFLGGVIAFGVASVADRRGPRGVLTATVLVGAAGFVLTSAIQSLAQFYLVYGVFVGVGMSSIYVLSSATVARWFVDRRGMALATVLSGCNLGWHLGGPFAAFLIERWGWRTAYVVLGLVVAGVGGPASRWVRYPDVAGAASRAGRGAAPTVRASFRSALGDARLWLLSASWFASGLTFMTVTVHSVPFAKDLGLSLDRAALALTAYGVGAAVGRLACGATADRFGAAATMYGCVLAQALALVALLTGPPAWGLVAVLVVFGVGAAGADTAFVKVVPDVFGLAALASVMSLVGLGWRAGAAVGPAAAGFLYDVTGSYQIPFAGALATLLLGGALFAVGARAAEPARAG